MTSPVARWFPPLLRVALGWVYLYAGLTKVFDATWSAKSYLLSATTFPGFYHALASPSLLPLVDAVNKYGLTLLGLSLITGLGLRFSTRLGAALMVLYYLPVLSFPYIGRTAFLVDEHIIYALALLWMANNTDIRHWTLTPYVKKWPGSKFLV